MHFCIEELKLILMSLPVLGGVFGGLLATVVNWARR